MGNRDDVWGFWIGVLNDPKDRSAISRLASDLDRYELAGPEAAAWWRGPAERISSSFNDSLTRLMNASTVAAGVISSTIVNPVESRIWVFAGARRRS